LHTGPCWDVYLPPPRPVIIGTGWFVQVRQRLFKKTQVIGEDGIGFLGSVTCKTAAADCCARY
jgi:hypothetical protein